MYILEVNGQGLTGKEGYNKGAFGVQVKFGFVCSGPRGCRDWKKIHEVDFGCKLGWEIDF
jgi:hypothetical protein